MTPEQFKQALETKKVEKFSKWESGARSGSGWQERHKQAAKLKEDLAVMVSSTAVRSDSSLEAWLLEDKNLLKSLEIEEAQDRKNGLDTISHEKLDQGLSDEEWGNRVNTRRNEAKEVAVKHIDDAYDRVYEAGLKHPSWQDPLLNYADWVFQAISDIFDHFIEFVTELVEKIAEWLKKVFDEIVSWWNLACSTITSIFE
ncbi:MAG: hypothetical protein F6K36_17335 [Symploca sp. SIO3C6]|nr:hypothetical protein [Symploca sp. SIO3C6]